MTDEGYAPRINEDVVEWLMDPVAETQATAYIKLGRERHRRYLQIITAGLAEDLAVAAVTYPNASPELLTGMIFSGVKPEEERLYQQAQQWEMEINGSIRGSRNFEAASNPLEAVDQTLTVVGDKFREATRYAGLLFEGFYNEQWIRPAAIAALSHERGEGFFENIGDKYAATGGPFLGAFTQYANTPADERNVGTGYFAQSDISKTGQDALGELQYWAEVYTADETTDTERDWIDDKYAAVGWQGQNIQHLTVANRAQLFSTTMEKKIYEDLADPETPLGKTQAPLGTPYTELGRAQRNAVYWSPKWSGAAFSGGAIPGQLGQTDTPNQTQYIGVSPGRTLASVVTETGTQPYHWASGIGDFVTQIGGDPANILGVGLTKGKGLTVAANESTNKLFTGLDDAYKVIDETEAGIRTLGKTDEVVRYNAMTSGNQNNARRLADNIDDDDLVSLSELSNADRKYHAAGSAMRRMEYLQQFADDIDSSPLMQKWASMADSTRVKAEGYRVDKTFDQVTTGPGSQKAALQRTARQVENRIQRRDAAIAERQRILTSPEADAFKGWKPSTQERALGLADQADIDAVAHPDLAKLQRVGRKVAKVEAEIGVQEDILKGLQGEANLPTIIKRQSGILDGIRPDIDDVKVAEFIGGKGAYEMVDALRIADAAGVDRILSGIKGTVARQIRPMLADADTRAEVVGLLLSQVQENGRRFAPVITQMNAASPFGSPLLYANLDRIDSALTNSFITKNVNDRVAGIIKNSGESYNVKPLYSGQRFRRAVTEQVYTLDSDNLDVMYDALALYARNFSWERGDETLEAVLRQLAETPDGAWQQTYNVLRNFHQGLFNHLTEGGVDQRVIDVVTRFTADGGEGATFFINRMGHPEDVFKTVTRVNIDGSEVLGPGPQMLSETWRGAVHLPDASIVRKAASELDRMGSFMNWITTKGFDGVDKIFEERLLMMWGNKYMSKIWKPLVLLRPQWSLFIIGEEQVRLLADGVSPIAYGIKHPLQVMSVMLSDAKLIGRHADDLVLSNEYQLSQVGRRSFQGDWKPKGLAKADTVTRRRMADGKVDERWRDAWGGEYNQVIKSPVVRHLFRQTATEAKKVKPLTMGDLSGKGFFFHKTSSLNTADITESGLREGGFWSDLKEANRYLDDELDTIFVFKRDEFPDEIAKRDTHANITSRKLADEMDPDDVAKLYEPVIDMPAPVAVIENGKIRMLAAADPPATIIDDADRIGATVRWLQGDEGEGGAEILEKLLIGKDASIRQLLGTDDGLRAWVESVYARAHMKAGGTYTKIMDDGRIVDDAGEKVGKAPKADRPAKGALPIYKMTSPGLDELVDSYATGKLGGVNVKGEWSNNKQLIDADPGKYVEYDKVAAQLDRIAAGPGGDNIPSVMKTTMPPDMELVGTWDKITNFGFDWLMTKPTNYLSRSPAFAAYYWRRIGEMSMYMDDATKAHFLAKANAQSKMAVTEFNKAAQNVKGSGTFINRKSDDEFATLLKDRELVDGYAKAFALTRTEELLFDVSKRKQISDATSLMVPFMEAWMEFWTAWGRIAARNPLGTTRKVHQVTKSVRESNPFDAKGSGMSNNGFFREDAEGREYFTLPLISNAWQWLDPADREFRYSVDTLASAASSALPGTGPAFQLAVVPFIPKGAEFDGFRDKLAPYGPLNLLSAAVPSHIRTLLAATEIGRGYVNSPELDEQWNRSLSDAILYRLETDEDFQQLWRDDQKAAIKSAEGSARFMMLVQFGAKFVGPRSPHSELLAEDKYGFFREWDWYAQDYREMLKNNDYDQLAAHHQFVDRHGFDPMGITTPSTVELEPSSVTLLGADWEQNNPEVYQKYPLIAYYAGPAFLEDYSTFHSGSWQRAFDLERRERLSPKEIGELRDHRLAQNAYETRVRKIEINYGLKLDEAGWSTDDGGPGTDVREDIGVSLNRYRIELRALYPGSALEFGTGVSGIPSRASNDDKIDDLRKLIDNEPDMVANNPAINAASVWLTAYDYAVTEWEARGNIADTTAQEFWRQRQVLMKAGEYLSQQIPEFVPLWEEVLKRKVDADEEQYSLVEAAEYLIDPGAANG